MAANQPRTQTASLPNKHKGELIFVYGTLLSGEANAHVMEGQRLFGRAYTFGKIFDYGFAPGAIPDQVSVLYGEVWEVDAHCKDHLDQLEGVNHDYPKDGNYRLEPIEAVLLDSGEVVKPRIYWHNHSPSDRGRLIANGDWKRRMQDRGHIQ